MTGLAIRLKPLPTLLLSASALTLSGYLYARSLLATYPIENAPGAYDRVAARLPSGTLERYVAHFYSTWTLRLEGLAARLAGVEHREGQDYAHGLFRVVARDEERVIVEWGRRVLPRIPPTETVNPAATCTKPSPPATDIGLPKAEAGLRDRVPSGGSQELRCQRTGRGGEVEISYTCRDWYPAGPENGSRAMIFVHRLYMRFLFDQARRKMAQESMRSGVQ